jgi:3-hydroxyisobutyrate dehydrogenase
MKNSQDRIGFVGVGRMGANMARRIKDIGYGLVAVYDSVAEQADLLGQELGCAVCTIPAGVAEQANIIFTVVTDDSAMRMIFDEEGKSSLVRHAQGRIFINCATVSPCVHQDVEQIVHTHGGETLEACMASSITQAREGTLYLMCGGKREVFDRVKPILDDLSVALRYVGAAGEAAKVKALVNMVMNANTVALAEGLGLGAALGVDIGLLREIFSQTGAASRVLETDGADMEARDHECYFSAEHAAKDSRIALSLAEELGLNLPVARATSEQYQCLMEIGKGHLDKSAIAELTFPGRL